MNIRWKAVEQYFTVVLFVFQFYPVCNFQSGKFIDFGLGAVRLVNTDRLKYNYGSKSSFGKPPSVRVHFSISRARGHFASRSWHSLLIYDRNNERAKFLYSFVPKGPRCDRLVVVTGMNKFAVGCILKIKQLTYMIESNSKNLNQLRVN